MADIIIQNISESDYSAILRQAVAVIDKSRAIVARSVCATIGAAHWELGKLLHEQKIESNHGSSVVNRLSLDLKIGEFKPKYAGKMNYYLSLLDHLERQDDENRSIGIILCAEKDKVEVELALEDMGKPIGVADYHLIIPQEELKRVVADEVDAFGNELPYRTKLPLLDSEQNNED